jgi:transcriptional regulator with XRE-family HTH domain/tetratricopeptide (TPR) repeat protein
VSSRAGLPAPALLVELRRAAGLTQEELAERTGLSARSIGDLERGATRRPRRASLEALADALGIAGPDRLEFVAHYRVPEPGPAPESPAQLPAVTAGFTGRQGERRRLDQLVRTGSPLVVIEGGAGMGKTELALRWAHDVRSDYPDGQLFAELHGFGAVPAAAPSRVLEHFLRSLGVDARDVPDGEDARAAMFRSRLADRRVLVVLDDALDSAQVQPLLPGTPSCTAIVTSRRRLDGLRARCGAARLEVGELSEDDAGALLDQLTGTAEVDPGGRRLALRLCAGMPLALRLIAVHLARAIRDRSALDLLTASDDPRVGVRELLSWSDRVLDPDAHRLLRVLGLLPVADPHVSVAAAACGWDLPRTRDGFERLADVNMIQSRSPGRYGMHELVREYARERASELPAAERAGACDRVETLFLAAALAASRRLGMVTDLAERDRVAVPAALTGLVAPDVQGWLRDHRGMVAAVARQAQDRGAHAAVRRLSDAWWRHLYKDMRDAEAHDLHSIALRSAESSGDRLARCRALRHLGVLDTRAGRGGAARRRFDEAARVAHDLGDPAEEAEATGLLASMHAALAEYGPAIDWLHRTLELTDRVPDCDSRASVLNNLGMLHRKTGDLDRAAAVLGEALREAVARSDTDAESAALNNLGSVERERGDLAAAESQLRAALDAARRACNREGEAVVLTKLADVAGARGDVDAAKVYLDAAAGISAESGTPHLRNLVWNARGEWALTVHDLAAAAHAHQQVLLPAADVRDLSELARAYAGLGRVARARGRTGLARDHLRRAAEVYRRLGSPHAAAIEAQLRGLAD